MSFEEFVRSLGIRPRKAVVPDGKLYRCGTESHPKSKNGAYLYALDGASGWAQDWGVHAKPIPWRPEKPVEVPTFDPVAARRRWEAEREKQATAIERARAFYAACERLQFGHPYLQAHGLDMAGCYGLKVDRKGWLVVPAYRGRELMTVQRIAPDGTKRFAKGAPVKGASYTINRRGATVTVLCEGLATGIALYACVPMSRVVVAFNTGNMTEVAGSLPQGFAVVAADNDHRTAERIGSNPGIEAAERAAELLGCGVAVPECLEGESDFCDIRQRMAEAALHRKHEHQPESTVRRAVDAEIGMQIMRHANFRHGAA